MQPLEDMPVPGLKGSFALELLFGPVLRIGRLATGGERSYRPLTGGRLFGEGIDAPITGGGESRLARADGVTVIDAAYLAELDGSIPLRIVATGFAAADTRLSLVFEVDQETSAAHLADRAFIALGAGEADLLDVFMVV